MAYVYRFRHYLTNEVIYVGKTKRNINTRMKEHFSKRGHLPKKCYKSVGKIEYIHVPTDADAQLVELYLINKYKPKYNKEGKSQDSQSFKYNLVLRMVVGNRWVLYSVRRKSFVGFRVLRFFKVKEPKDLVCVLFKFAVVYFIFYSIITLFN